MRLNLGHLKLMVSGDIWSAVGSTQFLESKTQVVERSFGAQPPCQSILQNLALIALIWNFNTIQLLEIGTGVIDSNGAR